MAEYGFVEGKDFSSFLSQSTGGRPSLNHSLTLDTAKEIAMLQRTEKGKQVRLYFIEAEKQLRQNLLASLDQSRRLDVIRAEERARFWESNHRTVTANGHSVRLPANTRLSEVSSVHELEFSVDTETPAESGGLIIANDWVGSAMG